VPRDAALRRVAAIAVVVTAAYAAPILGMGFDLDSVAQLDFLEGVRRVDYGFSPLGLWNFSNGSAAEQEAIRQGIFEGSHPWCAQTVQPADKMFFLRVIPSALLLLDHRLFGVAPLGYQVHTLLWLLVVLLSVGVLFERVLPPGRERRRWAPTLAGGALLLFGVDATHAEVMSMTSIRYVWVATAFGVWALWAHVRWRTEGWRPGPWLSVALLVLALLSSENAFQLLAYFLAFELLRREEPLQSRLRALMPAALIALAYVVLYTASGHGARDNQYIDPFREPGELLHLAPIRFADFLIEELLGLPALLGWQRPTFERLIQLDLPQAARLLLALGLLSGLLAWLRAALRRDPDRDGAVAWLALGGVLSLAPVLLGQPGQRALLAPSIGLSAAIALLIASAWRTARDPAARSWVRFPLAGAGLALLVVHALASPAALLSQLEANREFSRALIARWIPGETLDPSVWSRPAVEPEGPPVTDVVVLAAPSISVPGSTRPELRTLVEGERPVARPPGQRWWFLSNNVLDYGHVLKRSGRDRFELALGPVRAEPPRSHNLWIGCGGVRGQVVATRVPRIAILNAADNGNILGISVVLDRSLDDPSLWIASWRDGALRRITPPPEGGRLDLP
jgi:uncharacterized membrane protein